MSYEQVYHLRGAAENRNTLRGHRTQGTVMPISRESGDQGIIVLLLGKPEFRATALLFLSSP